MFCCKQAYVKFPPPFGCSVLHQARVHKVDPKEIVHCPAPKMRAATAQQWRVSIATLQWSGSLGIESWKLWSEIWNINHLLIWDQLFFFCSGCAFFFGGGGNAFGDGDFRRPLKNQSKNSYHRTLFEFQEFGGWKMCFCVFFFWGGGGAVLIVLIDCCQGSLKEILEGSNTTNLWQFWWISRK